MNKQNVQNYFIFKWNTKFSLRILCLVSFQLQGLGFPEHSLKQNNAVCSGWLEHAEWSVQAKRLWALVQYFKPS